MRIVTPSNGFKRDYKLLQKRHKDLTKIEAVIKLLANDMPLEARHENHPLKGNYVGFWDCHVEPDWILVYCKGNGEDEKPRLYLEATGTHADLF
jgi:mRNA interferase YafQ